MSKNSPTDKSAAPANKDEQGQNSATGTSTAPAGPTVKDVVKVLKAKGVKVRVPKTDKDGNTSVIKRSAGEDDILSFRVSDDERTLTVVTIDGQKYTFGEDE